MNLSGFNRFESTCVDLDGEAQWTLPVSGCGTPVSDDRVAFLVGSNESPKWDNWELRTFTTEGDDLDARVARGQACAPPVIGSDGALYFTTFFKPLDPAESRIDYTSFGPQPAFVAFDFLMRVKAASHQYDVHYFRATEDGDLERIFEDGDSVAFGPAVAGERHVFFAHNRDLLVYSTK